MWKLLKNLRQDESGQDLIEYGLIAALLALAAVASMKSLSTALGTVISNIETALTAAAG